MWQCPDFRLFWSALDVRGNHIFFGLMKTFKANFWKSIWMHLTEFLFSICQIIDNRFGKTNSDSPQNAFSQFKCFLSTDKVLSRHIFRFKSKIKPWKVWLFLCNVYLMLYWRNISYFSLYYLKNFEWLERFVFWIRRFEKMLILSDDYQMVNRIRDSN